MLNVGETFCATTGSLLFEAGSTGPVLQIHSGAVRLDHPNADGPTFVQLALPGDLIGLEREAGLPYAFSARAVVPSRYAPAGIAVKPEQRMDGWQQQNRRCIEALRMRSGSAPERLRHLLLLLSQGNPSDDLGQTLPTLKDMAAIIDSAPETVSRILGSLKRASLLQERHPQAASFDPERLRVSPMMPGMTCSRVDAVQLVRKPSCGLSSH